MARTAWIIICIITLPFVATAQRSPQAPQRRLTEAEHQKVLAAKFHAKAEVILWDRTRIDLVNDQHVIEIDFAPKWAEAIGQALYYSIADPSDRTPAIILLVDAGQDRFAHRCQAVCARHGIKLFVEPVQHHEQR